MQNTEEEGQQNYSPMFIIGNTIVSDAIIEQNFVCNIEKCKGACCIEGDQGAPLDNEDIEQITENMMHIKPYMSDKGRKLLADKGFYETDSDGDKVTTCLPTGECVFVVYDNVNLGCAIQKANTEQKFDYPKPISCHLYPIRVSNFKQYDALGYHEWNLCSPACTLGNQLKVPVYKFLEEPLVRKYGQEWWDELHTIAKDWGK